MNPLVDLKDYKAKKDHSNKYMITVIILMVIGSSNIVELMLT